MRPFVREPRSNEVMSIGEIMPDVVGQIRKRQWDIEAGLVKTTLPTESELIRALGGAGLKMGCGAGDSIEIHENYSLAKEVLRFYWELPPKDYHTAISMICKYLNYY